MPTQTAVSAVRVELVGQHGVDELGGPLALGELAGHVARLAAHAELVEHTRRGGVALVEPGGHPMQPEFTEQEVQ